MEGNWDQDELLKMAVVGLQQKLKEEKEKVLQKEHRITELEKQLEDSKIQQQKSKVELSTLKSLQTNADKALKTKIAEKDAIIADLTQFIQGTKDAIGDKLSEHRLTNQPRKPLQDRCSPKAAFLKGYQIPLLKNKQREEAQSKVTTTEPTCREDPLTETPRRLTRSKAGSSKSGPATRKTAATTTNADAQDSSPVATSIEPKSRGGQSLQDYPNAKYHCFRCKRGYTRISSLNYHFKSTHKGLNPMDHNPPPADFAEICGDNALLPPYDLESHRPKFEPTLHHCSRCGKSFSLRLQLKLHLKRCVGLSKSELKRASSVKVVVTDVCLDDSDEGNISPSPKKPRLDPPQQTNDLEQADAPPDIQAETTVESTPVEAPAENPAETPAENQLKTAT